MVISDYIKIIRPANAFMVFAMVMAGIWFSDPQFIWWKYLLAAVVPISYTGIAMIHNDIIDLDIDIINAPDRPIPSGRITTAQAKIYSWFLFLIGTLSGIWLGIEAVVIMAITLVLSLLYNSYLKKTGFLGNLTVGFTATSAFLYGDVVSSGWDNFSPISDWTPSIYLFLVSALLNTSREISKGIMDIEGDKTYGVRTIAVVHGKKVASYFVVLFVTLALLLCIIPMINQTFGLIFIIAVIAFIILIIQTGIPLIKNPNYETAKNFKNYLLPNMFIALVLAIIDVLF